MFAHPAHLTTRRTIVVGLVAILLIGGLFARGAANPAPVLAFHCPPGEVDVVINHTVIVCVPAEQPPNPFSDIAPDQLLNRGQINGGRHYATDAQKAALAALTQTAVSNTAQTHQVPASELTAVQTWGRADAQAELWGLVVKAIRTPACPAGVTTDCRTADQQHVVDWMSAMARRQGMETAIAAGLELVKYSGLSQEAYQALFADGAQPTQETLQAFLTIEPLNYNSTDKATATGGYCIYRSPAPYQSEYTGYNDQTCFTPCSSVLGCDDPMPDTEQFIKWGAATWTNGVYDTAEYASATRSISLSVGLGGLAASVVAGVTLATTLGAVLAGTSFTAAIFPFAASVTVFGGFAGTSAATITTAASTAAAGVMAASAVAAIAAAVVLFITGTTIRAIDLFTDLAVPGDIAKAIVDSRTAAYDPATMITDNEDHYTLYQLFVGATVPGPLYESCNNYFRNFPVQAMCLNAPAIPAATAADPQFIVTDHATVTSPASATTISPTISFYTPGIGVRYVTETRLHGTWFIHNLGGSVVQTFRIRFGDWTGAMHTAWLLKKDSGAYSFFGIPDGDCAVGATCQGPVIVPTTCVADGTCWESSAIKYVGTDGVFHTAAVRSPAAVTWPTPAAITYPAPLTATQLNASATGLDGTFAYTVDGSPVSASDNRVLGGGAHTLGVTFSPAESTGLLPGTAEVSLTVNKASLSVTAPTASMPYGSSAPALAPQYGSFVNGDDASDIDTPPTCSTSADGDSPVGDSATTCTGGADGDYTFSFVAGKLTVTPAPLTIAAPTLSMRYGDAVPAIEPVYLGLVSGDTASAVTAAPVCSTTATSASPVGPYLTQCTGGTVPNYTVSHQAGILSVRLRGLIITPDDFTKKYGDNLTFTGTEFSALGLVNGDTITSLTIISAGASASAPVRDTPYVIEGKDALGTGLNNYLILHGDGELIVEKRDLTITADDAMKTYGQSVTFGGTEFSTDGLANADTVTAVSLASNGAGTAAGVTGSPYAIEPSTAVGTGLANYDVSYVDGHLTVNPAPLTLTASSAMMVLGGIVPVIQPLFSGFVAGDTAEDVSETSCGTTATSASPLGTYPSSCSGGIGPNYTTTPVAGAVTVTFDTPTLFDEAMPVKSGANLPIKVQLRDASGTNLSSPATRVSLATPVALAGPTGTAVPRQPTGSFKFVNNRDNGPMYQYDLKTTGLGRGTYTLYFTVAGDPFTHSLAFTIR
jgi:hypothetical protein